MFFRPVINVAPVRRKHAVLTFSPEGGGKPRHGFAAVRQVQLRVMAELRSVRLLKFQTLKRQRKERDLGQEAPQAIDISRRREPLARSVSECVRNPKGFLRLCKSAIKEEFLRKAAVETA